VALLLLGRGARRHLARSPTPRRAALHRLGRRWRRPRLALPRKVDPAKTATPWRIVEAVLAAGPAAAGLDADESRVPTLPLVRALWSWVGQQWRIPTPGATTARASCGARAIRPGRWTSLVRERRRPEDVRACLERLVTGYPAHPSILSGDNDRSHTAGDVRDWLGAHPRRQRHFLPTHGAHRTPVARLWRHRKGDLAAHRLSGAITRLLASVDRFFAAMTPEQALTWAAEEN